MADSRVVSVDTGDEAARVRRARHAAARELGQRIDADLIKAILTAADVSDAFRGIFRIKTGDEAVVERVAQSIHHTRTLRAWDKTAQHVRDFYLHQARAVLGALRGDGE